MLQILPEGIVQLHKVRSGFSHAVRKDVSSLRQVVIYAAVAARRSVGNILVRNWWHNHWCSLLSSHFFNLRAMRGVLKRLNIALRQLFARSVACDPSLLILGKRLSTVLHRSDRRSGRPYCSSEFLHRR